MHSHMRESFLRTPVTITVTRITSTQHIMRTQPCRLVLYIWDRTITKKKASKTFQNSDPSGRKTTLDTVEETKPQNIVTATMSVKKGDKHEERSPHFSLL